MYDVEKLFGTGLRTSRNFYIRLVIFKGVGICGFVVGELDISGGWFSIWGFRMDCII